MSVITPARSVDSHAADNTSSSPAGFPPPAAPEPDPIRDNELINYYFDGNFTTKDIAEHFKVSIAVIAAWFQRPDIVAIIEFVATANERGARDIARENLPGTIDILHRISRVRNSDTVARQASSALIRFARGDASAAARASVAKRAADDPAQEDSAQPSPQTRSRRAGTATPPRTLATLNQRHAHHDDEPIYSDHDQCRTPGNATEAPDRPAVAPLSLQSSRSRQKTEDARLLDPPPDPVALASAPPRGCAC